jgi:phage tail-like protein
MTATPEHTISRQRFLVVGTTLFALACLCAHPVQAQPRDHRLRYAFTVEFEGVALGMFREASGLGIEVEVLEFRDGSTNDIRKHPGRLKWDDIVLKRGFTGNTELYDWATAYARTGSVVRRSGSIVMYDQAGHTIARWNFHNAWPVKWEGPVLTASGNDVAIETLVLAHDGLSLSPDEH